ncbi:MAG TPA: glycoside hydrolase family 44 protein [Thermoanaerobaculia bacterium]|jgi:hypothetical protein|nr:glycoside hydrolase family 44 protein [Thermoanaerobaculia bacterium]
MKRSTLCLAAALLSPFAFCSPSAAAPLTVYDDQLRNGFDNWSWAANDLAQTGTVHSGHSAVSFEPDGWSGLFLHRDAGIDTALYEALELWIHGGAAGGQNLRIAFVLGGDPVGEGALTGFIPGIPAGNWVKIRIPFAALGVTSGIFDGFWLQDGTGGNQPAVYVDDIQLAERTTPPPPAATIQVSIDPGADRRRISALIYGVNFGDATQAARLKWPVRRWGGNSTTRYSWRYDVSNHASDWFFYNLPESNPNPSLLPNGSAADRFIDETRAYGGAPLITVPIIGWTPFDRQRRWGFSVRKYGAQRATECTAAGNASWCQPDAGNGERPDGKPITGNNPRDTSRKVGPAFVTGWMDHIRSYSGVASVRLFELDNEPMLWNSTHRDVHPQPVTYDELWQTTRTYAAAMKAKDPGIQILGPSDWGWCAYFFSAADGCAPGADAQAHGNVPFLPWYLGKVREHQQTTGVRLIDYLDVHYYPQSPGVALSDDESAATAARRLRSLKGLYDPTYVDESWIGQPVRLIPRLKEWIAARLPGVKLAITEYNWGNDDGPSSVLAQAEALAIFGREGVDLATRWVAPKAGSRVEDAFRLYLDYDGHGARVGGTSVRALSSDVNAVGAYAIAAGGTRLYVLLFNKDTAERRANVQVTGGLLKPAQLYRFDPAHRLASAGTATPAGGILSLALPPRSATLVVVDR